jgi:hypothetical protein
MCARLSRQGVEFAAHSITLSDLWTRRPTKTGCAQRDVLSPHTPWRPGYDKLRAEQSARIIRTLLKPNEPIDEFI